MDPVFFIASILAGIFGAAIGALPAFVFVGFLVLAGVAVSLGGGADAGAFLGAVPFGVFAPSVAGFASGVAGAAYAAKKGALPSGRDIATPLMGLNDPMTLAIGAVFGAIGYLIVYLVGLIPIQGAWTDFVALGVVVSAIIARLVFGCTGVFGQVPRGKSRFGAVGDQAWLPWQSSVGQLVLIGLGAGGLSALFAVKLGVGGALGFGLSAASLILLQFGQKVPVTHHITLIGGLAAAASLALGASPMVALLWGTVFGLVSAFVGEAGSRLFLIFGDTHIDPPAVAIVVMTFVSWLVF